MRTGSCKFGVACKFHHPQPAFLGNSYPVAGPTAFVSTGPSSIPSAGPYYIGSAPTWSLPRAPYISGPRLQGPQAYVPVVFSPSQSIVPGQGWNTYMVSFAIHMLLSYCHAASLAGDGEDIGWFMVLLSPEDTNFLICITAANENSFEFLPQ